jgi:UPF0755 protein
VTNRPQALWKPWVHARWRSATPVSDTAAARRGRARLPALLALTLLALAAPAGAAAPVTLKIIFPEGFTVRRMADQVSAVRRIAIRTRHVTPVLNGRAYATAARHAAAPAAFRRDDRTKSIEGFLYPAGYLFTPSTRASDLIRQQILDFEQVWGTLDLRVPRARHLSQYDVLTIASMIERETVAPEERKLVAAVIYNRLAKGMPLGIDATLRYGLGIQGTEALTAADLRNQTPYNTSIHKGLPPTPIGNPGLPSMRAAARPAHVDYLYYVRKPDRVHHFFTASEQEFCARARAYGYGC